MDDCLSGDLDRLMGVCYFPISPDKKLLWRSINKLSSSFLFFYRYNEGVLTPHKDMQLKALAVSHADRTFDLIYH